MTKSDFFDNMKRVCARLFTVNCDVRENGGRLWLPFKEASLGRQLQGLCSVGCNVRIVIEPPIPKREGRITVEGPGEGERHG